MLFKQITIGKRCPVCKKRHYRRTRRKNWMRSLPSTKYYSCRNCNFYFIVFYETFSFKIGNKKKKTKVVLKDYYDEDGEIQ